MIYTINSFEKVYFVDGCAYLHSLMWIKQPKKGKGGEKHEACGTKTNRFCDYMGRWQ